MCNRNSISNFGRTRFLNEAKTFFGVRLHLDL